MFLTGVPGAGKTLAGLQVVHDAVTTGTEDRGDVVYLSGNTPLVVVLREALHATLLAVNMPPGFDHRMHMNDAWFGLAFSTSMTTYGNT